jgi:hypothetical protein
LNSNLYPISFVGLPSAFTFVLGNGLCKCCSEHFFLDVAEAGFDFCFSRFMLHSLASLPNPLAMVIGFMLIGVGFL